ncbi:FAD-binding protein [Enhygromyxa salina]|nr:FAD-binding protein [Enhygromyxa salina]
MEFADDFGHIVHLQPRAVERPRDAADIVRVLEHAKRERINVAARGRGHSVFGQCQVDDGIVLDMSGLAGIEVNGDTARVGAGVSWGDVLRATVPLGLAPPVLTDYVGLSVGGTLSVGGIGATSFRFGAQTDQVRAMTVVTGTGEIVECSATRERGLFDAVRAGLGQIGIVTRVDLPLIAVPEQVRHYRIPYPTIDELLSALERFVAERKFDQLSGVGVIDPDGHWTYHIDAVFEGVGEGLGKAGLDVAGVDITPASYLEYGTRLDAAIEQWRTAGLFDAPHPWLDVFVPGPALRGFARTVVRSLGPRDLGTDGAMILIYPIAESSTPLLPIQAGRGYLFDVLRCNVGASSERVDELLRDNRSLYEAAMQVGGTLYPISAVCMSTQDWQRHFGSQWGPLQRAKQQFDPHGIIGSNYRAPWPRS